MDEPKPKVYAGIKWGLQAPTVLLAAQYWPAPRDHIQVIRERFQREMMLEDAIAVAKEWKRELVVRKFFCDPTQPEFVRILRKQRLWAVMAPKEVSLAINLVKRRLSNFEKKQPCSLSFNLLPGHEPRGPRPVPGDFVCPNLLTEFGLFRGQAARPNQPFRDKPLEADHYALSALHFLLLGLATEVTPRVRWL